MPARGHRKAQPNRCLICTHPDKLAIDADILNPELSLTDVGDKWGISKQVVTGHRGKHLAPMVQRALRRRGENHAEDKLLEKVLSLQKTTDGFIAAARAEESPSKAAPLIREARENLQLEAIITGRIGPQAQVPVNVQRAIFVLPRDEEMARMIQPRELAPAEPVDDPD